MPDIDSLSIEIKSSSKPAITAIDNIITALGRLNAALNNYTDGSDYTKGMNGLVKGLTGISSAVNSIDLEKIKTLTSSLGSLATAGEKLSKLNFVQSFSQLGSELQRTNSAASLKAKEMAKVFHIPKEAMGEWTEGWKKVYGATDSTDFYVKAVDNLDSLVRKYAQVEGASKELQEQYKAEQKAITGSKKYVSSNLLSNYGDQAKSLRGKLNIRNTTSNMEEGTDLVTLARENQILADSEYEAMEKMTELSNAASDATARTNAQSEAIYKLDAILQELEKELNLTKASVKDLDNEFLTAANDGLKADDIFGSPLEMQEAASSISQVSNATAQLETQSQELGNPFEGLIYGLESLKEFSIPAEQFAGISSLAASLNRFGNRNAQSALTIIPQVGNAFRQMMTSLANAPQISDNVVRLAEALSKFSKSGKQAATSASLFSRASKFLTGSMKGLPSIASRSHRGFTSLASIFGKLYANFFLVIRAARLLGQAMDYSSSMTEAQNVVNVVFGKSAKVMDDFAETAIKDFGLARLSAVQFASRFQAMGSTMGITSEAVAKANDYIAAKISGNARAYKDLGDSVADMSVNLTKLTADIASLYNQNYEDVAQDMQAIYTGMTRPLRKYGLDLTQATLKEWALANGLDANIEKMSQAEKTMLRYQYVMSRAAGAMGDFQKTQDTWANSLRTVKQLLQEVARTIGEGLINALRPALIAFKKFLFNFLELTESALNAIGKLLGWKQIDFGGAALVEDTEDYADALDDAAGAAKKLKGQLRGIDELNNLTTNNGSGGGAGGDSGLGAGIESIWDQITDTEKLYESAINSWKEFGQKIAEKIKEGLSSIDWETIFANTIAFGTNFASFLNGLFDPEMFKLIGETIGNSIMTGIKFAFAFGQEFDFENFGTAIAEGINGFFDKFSGEELAETINTWIGGLETTLTTAAQKIKWKEVFKDLFDFFTHIDIDSLGFVIAPAAITLATIALRTQIMAAIPTLAISVAVAVIGFKVGNWIGEQWEEALGVNEATGETYWYEFWEKIFKIGEKAFKSEDPLKDTYGGILDKLLQNITLDIEDYFGKYGIWGLIFSPVLGEAELVQNLFKGIDADDLFDISALDPYIKAMKDLDEAILKGATYLSTFADMSNIAGIISAGESLLTIGDNSGVVEAAISGLTEKFNEFTDNIPTAIETAWNDTVTFWTAEVPKFFSDNVLPWFTLEKWLDIFKNIYDSFVDIWNDTTDFFNTDTTDFIEGVVKPFFTKEAWASIFGGITDAIKQTLGDAKEFAKGFFNALADFAEGFINGVIDGFGKIVSAKSILSDSSINFNVSHISIPRFASGGYPSVGSLFLAGEAGAEMVGSMNGKTTVASNGEITGIADAIRSTSDVEIALLRQQNSLLQGILEKEFGVSKDDIFRSVRTSAREYTNRTGNPAFT